MKTEKVETTAKQINRLVEDIRQQPLLVSNGVWIVNARNELSDEEFLDNLTMDMMTIEEIDPIDDYPTDSPEYAAEIKRRAEITKELESEEGKQRLEGLSAKILAKLGIEPEPSFGEHLTEEICAAYATNQLSAEEIERIDAHLLSCSECADMVVQIATRVNVAAQLTGLIILTRVALRRARGDTVIIEDGQSKDGILRWRVVEDDAGNIIVRFGSHALELGSMTVEFRVGDLQREVVLDKTAPDQVGAELILTFEERASLPEDAKLQIVGVHS